MLFLAKFGGEGIYVSSQCGVYTWVHGLIYVIRCLLMRNGGRGGRKGGVVGWPGRGSGMSVDLGGCLFGIVDC